MGNYSGMWQSGKGRSTPGWEHGVSGGMKRPVAFVARNGGYVMARSSIRRF